MNIVYGVLGILGVVVYVELGYMLFTLIRDDFRKEQKRKKENKDNSEN